MEVFSYDDRREVVKSYIEQHPELGKKALANILMKDKPELFSSKSACVSCIHRLKSKLGEENQHGALQQYCLEKGLDPSSVTSFWYKGKQFSVNSKMKPTKSLETLAEDLIEDMKGYSPKYPVIKRSKSKSGHLLVIDPADIHIGKLATAEESGQEYNPEIAMKRVLEGVQGILDKTSGFEIDKIVFVAGNDILHTDNTRRTTTSNTPQDTVGMWYQNFAMAKDLYVKVLEMLIPVADVHYMHCPSNHDYMSGLYLSDVISAWFKDNSNITFDVSPSHRKYFTYGGNLIGLTHGDGAKMANLPLLMANESKDWSSATSRYIFTHHVHHKHSKDFPGCTVESLRSPSGTDSWHHRNGFQHAPKAVEGFLFDKENGQIARITHLF